MHEYQIFKNNHEFTSWQEKNPTHEIVATYPVAMKEALWKSQIYHPTEYRDITGIFVHYKIKDA